VSLLIATSKTNALETLEGEASDCHFLHNRCSWSGIRQKISSLFLWAI